MEHFKIYTISQWAGKLTRIVGYQHIHVRRARHTQEVFLGKRKQQCYYCYNKFSLNLGFEITYILKRSSVFSQIPLSFRTSFKMTVTCVILVARSKITMADFERLIFRVGISKVEMGKRRRIFDFV